MNNINKHVEVDFIQFFSKYNINDNLQNHDITSSEVTNINLSNKKKSFLLIRLISLILKYDFIYIFYPSSLGRLIGIISKLFNKPIGLYVRGEYFNKNIFDRLVLRHCNFICNISVICLKIKSLLL